MSVNLLVNAKKALTGYPKGKLVSRTDSSTALHRIRVNSNNKHFVKKCTDKIHEKKEIAWRYMHTTGNPVDIESRGMPLAKMRELWWKETGWFRDSDSWPSDIKTKGTGETGKETIIIKDFMTSTILKSDITDKILHRLLDLGKLLDFHKNYIMDTEIPTKLQKFEMGKTIKAFDDQRNREF